MDNPSYKPSKAWEEYHAKNKLTPPPNDAEVEDDDEDIMNHIMDGNGDSYGY